MTDAMHRERVDSRRLWALWVSVAAVLLVAIGAGLFLVFTDEADSGRNNLGVGLITGVATGLAVLVVEFAWNQQRRVNERENDERLRRGLLEYARGELARLVQRYARELETRLYAPLNAAATQTHPPSKDMQDARIVWRAVMWVSDIDRTDPDWFGESETLERVDVILLVATYYADNAESRATEDLDRLRYPGVESASRISGTADILSQFRAPDRAQRLAHIAGDLALAADTLDLKYAVGERGVPRLPGWLTGYRNPDGVEYIDYGGDRGMQFTRELLAYVVDLLRQFEEAKPSTPQPAESGRLVDGALGADLIRQRWPSLTRGAQVDESMYAAWLAEDSWLRQAVREGSERTSWSWGIAPETNPRSRTTATVSTRSAAAAALKLRPMLVYGGAALAVVIFAWLLRARYNVPGRDRFRRVFGWTRRTGPRLQPSRRS